jgi:hypothetical protein
MDRALLVRRALALGLLASTLALGGIAATACSSGGEEAAPSRPPIPPVTTEPDAATNPEGGNPDAGCNGPNACFACEPVALDEFLNACTDGQCTPFDNVKRLPLYKAGQALPPVP